MNTVLRWLRLILSCVLFVAMSIAACWYKTTIYLCYQANGQLRVLLNTQNFSDYIRQNHPDSATLKQLQLVEEIKQFSIDSLAYKPTNNFTSIYNQGKDPVLWVITACKPFSFEAYEWYFPLVGRVSYKGFFKKEEANKEYNHLRCMGYDVDLRPVSAWSTLGWFSDPLLSSMLARGKGNLSNLLFHELFHATYYAPSSVDVNENLASFVAHKATQQFLRQDTSALSSYLFKTADSRCYNNYMLRKAVYLSNFYKTIINKPDRKLLKIKALLEIADSVDKLPLHNTRPNAGRKADILKAANACFIDFKQYDALQDSLELVFNKIYKGNLKKLVQDLKLNGINY